MKLDQKQLSDIERLMIMLRFYCHQVHAEQKSQFEMPSFPGSTDGVVICDQCQNFLKHAIVKRFLCPLEPKPMCHECEIHCYAPKYREFAREMMQYWVRHTHAVALMHII